MLHEVGRALREEVARRAGHVREYCLIREEDSGFSHQIDHIVSLKHGGRSAIGNLALPAYRAIAIRGRTSIDRPSGEIIRLFHPRKDRWRDHFKLQGGLIVPSSDIGAATMQLLRLNSPEKTSLGKSTELPFQGQLGSALCFE